MTFTPKTDNNNIDLEKFRSPVVFAFLDSCFI